MSISDAILMTESDIQEYFESIPEGKVFWGSFSRLLNKTYGRAGDTNTPYVTPIVFKLNINNSVKYAGKLSVFNEDSVDIDIYSNLFESDSLLLLMSQLVRDYIDTQYDGLKDLSFYELALVLSDRQVVVGERIRQILIKLCNELEKLLKNENYEI